MKTAYVTDWSCICYLNICLIMHETSRRMLVTSVNLNQLSVFIFYFIY